MDIRALIHATGCSPITVESLKRDLMELGVENGMNLIVHSSLKSLGWVCGGAVAPIYAIEQAIGEEGTLVMPTQSGELREPSKWQNPPIPEHWWSIMRDSMPLYDPDMTPTRNMGVIPETFRKQIGAIRSRHPHVSFAARGPNANVIADHHGLDFGLGEQSPLARLYDLDGWVLLLGVGHDRNTSMHLAEHRASFPCKRVMEQGTPWLENGVRTWKILKDIKTDCTDFETIGELFDQKYHLVLRGKVGCANARLMPQKPLVDFAQQWMTANRM